MANQTVTTVVNYDDAAISGLLNGETITINGGSSRLASITLSGSDIPAGINLVKTLAYDGSSRLVGATYSMS